ncbi:MAG TPA: hypothetical protein PKE21_14285 [Flavobacteriales bacterium]|nr:hypothetical protein [Flavobacteriales bacterium]HMR28647.1 hypothetical protein [Flavobacteriales bacterium]
MNEEQTQPERALPDSTTLDELDRLSPLSTRAWTVCARYGLTTLGHLLDLAGHPQGFTQLAGCGKRTHFELMDLVARFATPRAATPEPATEQEPIRPLQDDVATSRTRWMLWRFNRLSVRTRNIVVRHAGGTAPEDLVRFFMELGRNTPKLPGVGPVVMAELRSIRAALVAGGVAPVSVTRTTPDTRSPLERWADRYVVSRTELAELAPRTGELYVLRFLQRRMTSGEADRNARIVQELLSASGDADPLSVIAQRHGLSRERVRQLRNALELKMPKQLAPIADLPGVRDHFAELTTTDDLFLVTPELVARANAREGTTWSPLLFRYLAQVLNAHRLVPLHWRGARGGDQGRAGSRGIPLVAEELLASLENALDRARAHHARPRTAPERLEVGAWMGGPPAEHRARVQALLIHLLPVYFGDTAMEGDTWVLPPNAEQALADMLEAVLQDLNEPRHVDEILSAWHRHYPERPITRSAIQSMVRHHRTRFFSIGRTSTYGLRRWEAERRSVKGGTIRNIVAEFLADHATPVHLAVIEEHVRHYRPGTHATSIRHNLKLDTHGRFQFIGGGYIGLTGKAYQQPAPPPPTRVPASLLRTSVLLRFIGAHRRELTRYLAERSGADLRRVERAVAGVVASGRLSIDAQGYIRRLGEAAQGPAGDELPLDWSA